MSNGTLEMFGVRKSATVSADGLYRYSLTRAWDEEEDLPCVLWIMLNPSTADAEQDDATIRRCIGFAKAWVCGSITVVNLFAYRATDPEVLKSCVGAGMRIAVGPVNNAHIERNIAAFSDPGDRIIAAWGAHGSSQAFKWRRDEVVRMLHGANVMCLDTTASGEPKHPLYCRADLMPHRWEGVNR